MKIINLLIDIDGVACDHASSICAWVNQEYGLTTSPSDITKWNHDFGPITFVEAVDICYKDEAFVLKMPTSHGFIDFYKSLNDIATITFATARQHSKHATEAWVEAFFPGSKLIFTKSKSLVDAQDYIIDDYHVECINCAKAGKRSFLLKRPWNTNESVKFEIARYNTIIHSDSFNHIFCTISRS